MNLRILKKLSKKAAPILAVLDTREQFKAARGDNYMSVVIRDRKHWERGASAHGDKLRDTDLKWKPRNPQGRERLPWCYAVAPRQPRKGTIMVGAVSGYYEPEWDEETAWEALQNYVLDQFTDWSQDRPTLTRKFKGPGDVLRAACELAAPSQGGKQ